MVEYIMQSVNVGPYIFITDMSTVWTDTQKSKHPVDMHSLPSAPRAVTTPVVNMDRLPKNPPFTVFIGNLSYEASEEDIESHFNKNHLSVSNHVH